ncbi:MAG: copper homeostasis protein CutC, partial [Clostridiales bacterium]|nr:copper homeostasis protein CutC [Clostridiales bacterium]
MKDYILEVCVDSVESAINATEGGANRLELCGNLIIGGTSPSPCLYKEVRKRVSNVINVLIRPRFGDFCYSDYEFEIMIKEVEMFRDLGADGVVIGILKPDGSLDIDRMKELVSAAGDMNVTLHRAFDVCKDPFEALESVAELGIDTILTSGQEKNAYEGRNLLKDLVARSSGKVDILLGGGVSADVIKELRPFTKAKSFHM